LILVGNQRGGARDLANHLMKDENDHVHVHELRGFVASDLMGAFKEAEMISRGTRCKQFLFSLSLNPPQDARVTVADFEKAIERIEDKLGLNGQPRAIVFHEKEGRRHAHAVWSRIDTSQMKAVQLSHSKTKLCAISKQLYLEHGWKLPAGHIDRSKTDPLNFTLEEWQQAKRTGQDPRAIKADFQEAWSISKTGPAFKEELEKRGYWLAQGNRRSHVAVDRFGEIYSVPRQLGIKTKEVRLKLDQINALHDVDIIKANVARVVVKRLNTIASELDQQIEAQKAAQRAAIKELVTRQRAERQALAERQNERQQEEARIRQSRFRKGLKGVWDYLRGEHHRIAVANRTEAIKFIMRDRIEGEAQIVTHLKERQDLSRMKAQTCIRIGDIQSQRIDLSAELKRYASSEDMQRQCLRSNSLRYKFVP